MPYTTFLGKTYDNEEDETCTREFGDPYKCLKREYPSLWELPKNEIQNMCKIFRTEGDTVEDGYEAVKKYLNKHPSYGTKTYTGQAENTNPNTTSMSTYYQAKEQNQQRLNDYYNKGFNLTGDQWLDVGKATLGGIRTGIETALDGATGGEYNRWNQEYNNDSYAERKNELMQEAKSADVALPYLLADNMTHYSLKAYTPFKLAQLIKTYGLCKDILDKSLNQTLGQ